MSKHILFFLLVFLGFAFSSSATSNSKPDFAYPKQVSQQAETNLNNALKNHDGNAVVRSLIDYSIAQSLINTDSIQPVLNKIEQVITKEKNPCTKALLNTLLVELYCNIYNQRKYTYNKRTNINADAPLDITEWSKNDFKQKILSLCDEALKNSDALKKSKLKKYSNLVSHNNRTFIYFPYLYDFIAWRLINSLDSFKENTSTQEAPINIDKFLATPIDDNGSAENKIKQISQDVLSFHRNDIAPLVFWDTNRIDYFQENLFLYVFGFKTNVTPFDKQKAEALNYLYKENEFSEYASIPLLSLATMSQNIYSTKELYNILSNRLKRFPAFSENCDIRNIINALSKEEINLSYSSQVVPNDTLTIDISNKNSKSFTVDIIKIPDDFSGNNNCYSFKKGVEPQVYKTFEMKCDSTIPFSTSQKIKTTITEPGYYSVIAYYNNSKKDINNVEVLFCSELYSFRTENINSDQRMWVLNPKTGNIITNALINVKGNGYIKTDKPIEFSFKSSREGKIKQPLKDRYTYTYSITKGNDHYSHNPSFYNSSRSDTTWNTRANCFTSLPLYHPGDTVAWSAVVYQYNHINGQRLATNQTYTISFRDANYMEINTAIVTTDRFGRIEGKFAIPTDRLTGNYAITISGKFNRNIASTYFMVSDYKLPTFDIKISDIAKQENGNYLISGEVRSFSGFALSNATVKLDLSARKYQFFNIQPFSPILNDSTITDTDGKFSFSITPPNYNDWKKMIFSASITATSQNGESQNASEIFTNGNPFYISAYYLNNEPIEVTKNIKLNITLHSVSGKTIDGSIYYIIVDNNEKTIKNGTFSTSNPIVDWSDIASGKYNIKLYSLAPTSTDTITENITLYRTSDALPPIEEGLWIQSSEYTISKDNSIDIIYGSTFNSGEILYLLYDNDKIYETRWIKAKKGIHKTRVFLPQHINEANIALFAINNYKSSNVTTTVKRASYNDIKISAQSFRDKITPGSNEQWTFNVTDKKGRGKESAMIMNMYSLAINKLESHSTYFNFYKPYISHYILNQNQIYPNTTSANNIAVYEHCDEIIIPKFDSYQNLISSSITSDEIVVRAASTPKSIPMALNSMAKGVAVENYAYAEESELEELTPSNASTTSSPTNYNSPSITLRENESPLAFFRPMLTTDTLGNLSFSFTVPNSNTTWLFNAIAYNENMVVADFARKVVANKPIMVQPNMPRFLRNGDKATIKASVMNNSDSTLTITTLIELFNPTNNKIIMTHRQTDTVSANESTLASIEITAPVDATMLGYRIKSYCDNFGDGEQSLLPILPATSPVIESTTFYIGANEHSYIQQLPSMPSEARVTLEFCENPTWYAVTALPGLNKNQSRASTSAAMAIYSAAMADGIVRQNPQIANALYEWQHSNKTDSTLVSMLSRNQDLKNMLLSATPWVQNAENDTERMARLSLLFNKKEIKATLDKNIHLLATLQRKGGGWAWIAECDKASSWATLSILEKIGHLKKLGFLPNSKDLNTMTENAIKYIDAEYVKLYKQHPKSDYSLYVFIRDMFPEYKQSTAAKKITNTTIQQIIGDWKRYSLVKKATSAIILNNNGYNSTAREILNSITEFSQSTTSRGMWWPTIENDSWDFDKILSHANILDAYHQITPNNKDIDKMRQWLIINKEANDWGNSSATSYVIYTLLNTGSRWTSKALGCEITLNNEAIETSHFDNITGYLRTDISNLAPSKKKLAIAKHGSQPAWGAVYRQYNAAMNEIEAVAGNDISIEKTLLKKVGNSWETASDYKVGDIIKIQLTIKVKRDIEYVTITDERAACFEPIEQLPKPIFAEGIYFYRENRDEATNIFVTHLPKGTYLLNYDMYVNNEGEFSSGIATIQSQYAPQITAHSAGNMLNISAQ